MTKAELIDDITENTRLKKKDVSRVVEAVFNTITRRIGEREKVQIVGFGTFEPRRRPARLGRDPRTQETLHIGPGWSLVFRPGKQLKPLLGGTSRKPSAD